MRLWKEPCCVRGIGCASQRSSLTRQRKRTCGRRATSGTYVTCWLYSQNWPKPLHGKVRVKIAPQEQALLAQPHPVDPEAYEAYLKGRYHWNRRSGEALPKAVQY